MKRRSGFTLIELLVCVAIILVLIAIMLPAVKMARRSSDAATCMANLRQLGVGFMTFAAEHSDLLPGSHTNYGGIGEATQQFPAGANMTNAGGKLERNGFRTTFDANDPNDRADQAILVRPEYEWMGDWLCGIPSNYTDYNGTYAGQSRKDTRTGFYSQPTRGTIYKYVNTVKAYRCPTLTTALGMGPKGLYGNGQYDYTMVQYVSGARVSRIARTTDAWNPNGDGRQASFYTPVLLEEDPGNGLNVPSGSGSLDGAWCANDLTSFNHRGGTNIMTLDGSVFNWTPPVNFKIKATWLKIYSTAPGKATIPKGNGGTPQNGWWDNAPFGWYSVN